MPATKKLCFLLSALLMFSQCQSKQTNLALSNHYFKLSSQCQAEVRDAYGTPTASRWGKDGTHKDSDADLTTARDWVWPINGKDVLTERYRITKKFLSKQKTSEGRELIGYLAIDLSGEDLNEKPFFAAANGEVVAIHRGLKKVRDVLVIRHQLAAPTSLKDQIIYSVYARAAVLPFLEIGQKVRKGEIIGLLSGPLGQEQELQFEIYNDYVYKNGPFCKRCPKGSLSPGFAGYLPAERAPFISKFKSNPEAVFYDPETFVQFDGQI